MQKPVDSPETPPKSPILRAKQQRSALAVEQILSAAECVFAETGLAGATTAGIAEAANVPRANLHYHFGTKEGLYKALLDNILSLWLDATDSILPEIHPAIALPAYIRAKMAYSCTRPHASKVFANEILHGAQHLRSYLGLSLRHKVEEKAAVVRAWIAKGWMEPVDPPHLFFLIWAMTQTYADFDAQIKAVLAVGTLSPHDYDTAEALIIRLVLRGCGITISPNMETDQ